MATLFDWGWIVSQGSTRYQPEAKDERQSGPLTPGFAQVHGVGVIRVPPQFQGFIANGQQRFGAMACDQFSRGVASDIVHVQPQVLFEQNAQEGGRGMRLGGNKDGLPFQLQHRDLGEQQHGLDRASAADAQIRDHQIVLAVSGIFYGGGRGHIQFASGHDPIQFRWRTDDQFKIVFNESRFDGVVDGQDVQVPDFSQADGEGLGGHQLFTGR